MSKQSYGCLYSVLHHLLSPAGYIPPPRLSPQDIPANVEYSVIMSVKYSVDITLYITITITSTVNNYIQYAHYYTVHTHDSLIAVKGMYVNTLYNST